MERLGIDGAGGAGNVSKDKCLEKQNARNENASRKVHGDCLDIQPKEQNITFDI
jgi:hypothetical protein